MDGLIFFAVGHFRSSEKTWPHRTETVSAVIFMKRRSSKQTLVTTYLDPVPSSVQGVQFPHPPSLIHWFFFFTFLWVLVASIRTHRHCCRFLQKRFSFWAGFTDRHHPHRFCATILLVWPDSTHPFHSFASIHSSAAAQKRHLALFLPVCLPQMHFFFPGQSSSWSVSTHTHLSDGRTATHQ